MKKDEKIDDGLQKSRLHSLGFGLSALFILSLMCYLIFITPALAADAEVSKEVEIEVVMVNGSVEAVRVGGYPYLCTNNKCKALIKVTCPECPDCTLNTDGLEDKIVANISDIVEDSMKEQNNTELLSSIETYLNGALKLSEKNIDELFQTTYLPKQEELTAKEEDIASLKLALEKQNLTIAALQSDKSDLEEDKETLQGDLEETGRLSWLLAAAAIVLVAIVLLSGEARHWVAYKIIGRQQDYAQPPQQQQQQQQQHSQQRREEPPPQGKKKKRDGEGEVDTELENYRSHQGGGGMRQMNQGLHNNGQGNKKKKKKKGGGNGSQITRQEDYGGQR